MSFKTQSLCTLALASIVSMFTTQSNAKEIDWRAVTIADIEAAYRVTKAEHPGMLDKRNPQFPALLERARFEALALANKTRTAGGHQATTGRFTAIIDDGHAGMFTYYPDAIEPLVQWPGFVAAWRGDSMFVYKSIEGGPPAGAQIMSCDGRPIESLIQTNVFSFRAGGKIPGSYWSSARKVFVDESNPFIQRPDTCLFLVNGNEKNLKLSWSKLPDFYQEWKDGSANGDELPTGITERSPGVFWIAMPTFQPDDKGVKAFDEIGKAIKARRSDLLNARAVVLDLRFNQGGSSQWSANIAGDLWGTDRVKRQTQYYFRDVEIWWRPTATNEAKFGIEYAQLFSKRGDAVRAAASIKLGKDFKKARAQNRQFFIEGSGEKKSSKIFKPANTVASDPPEFNRPVYVIVHGQCASACLDAIDYFKLFPNTRLIGAPSSADSTYMEVRTEQLPSKMGGTIIPMKIWVNRPRGNGVSYPPDVLMKDFDWSTANFLKRIEDDLKLRGEK